MLMGKKNKILKNKSINKMKQKKEIIIYYYPLIVNGGIEILL